MASYEMVFNWHSAWINLKLGAKLIVLKSKYPAQIGLNVLLKAVKFEVLRICTNG